MPTGGCAGPGWGHSPRGCPRARPPCSQALSWAWSCYSCFLVAAGAELPLVPPGKQVWDVTPGASTIPEGQHCWGPSHPEVGHLAPPPSRQLCPCTGEETEAWRSPRAALSGVRVHGTRAGTPHLWSETWRPSRRRHVGREGSKPPGPGQWGSSRLADPGGAGWPQRVPPVPGARTLRVTAARPVLSVLGCGQDRVTIRHPEDSTGTRHPGRTSFFLPGRSSASPKRRMFRQTPSEV